MKNWIVCVLLLALIACGKQDVETATEVTATPEINFAEVAEKAVTDGNWAKALEAWSNAIAEADKGNIPVEEQAVYFYERGRAAGVLCQWELAESDLQKAYGLDKASGGPLFMTLLELARLHLAQEQYDQAANYFEQAFPLLEQEQAALMDPVGSANIIDDYIKVLEALGEQELVKEFTKKSNELREPNKQYAANTVTTPYGSECQSGS